MNKYPSLIQNNQMPQIKDKPFRRPFLQKGPLLQGMNIYFMSIAFHVEIWTQSCKLCKKNEFRQQEQLGNLQMAKK